MIAAYAALDARRTVRTNSAASLAAYVAARKVVRAAITAR